MKFCRHTGAFITTLMCLFVSAAENSQGILDSSSTGGINLSLEINDDIRAGFLQPYDDTENQLMTLISSGIVQVLSNDESATLSLCIVSSGGGTFEVTALELPGEQDTVSQFGKSAPLQIGFGEEDLETVKYKAAAEECSRNTAIPVTIQLHESSGREVGKIHGRLNLLVKSE